MSSKNSVASKDNLSSFIRQDLLAPDQRDFLILSHSNVLVESLNPSRGRHSDIQVSAPRPIQTNQWWTTFTSIPVSQNPLSISNQGIIDDIRQTGSTHFLGGAFGGTGDVVVERDVFVAQNQSIVIPLLTSGIDNVGWDFGPDFPVPYQFTVGDLQIINDAIMDTATDVSLFINGVSIISDENKDDFRVASRSPYTLNLPEEDDILGYRAAYDSELVKPPYTKGVQDGYWVEIKNLPLGEHLIQFSAAVSYGDIEVLDYDGSGSIGDTPLETLLQSVQESLLTTRFDVTYDVTVLSRPAFNAQLQLLG